MANNELSLCSSYCESFLWGNPHGPLQALPRLHGVFLLVDVPRVELLVSVFRVLSGVPTILTVNESLVPTL